METPTKTVKIKSTGVVCVINESDFDEDIHETLGAIEKKEEKKKKGSDIFDMGGKDDAKS